LPVAPVLLVRDLDDLLVAALGGTAGGSFPRSLATGSTSGICSAW
jgi:hypothetical protein